MKKTNNLKMSPYKYFQILLNEVKLVNIVTLFDRYGLSYDTNATGARKYSECFICKATIKDKKANINSERNGFICYSCTDKPLSPISCIMEKQNMDFKKAVVDIAKTLGLRPLEEIQDYEDSVASGEKVEVNASSIKPKPVVKTKEEFVKIIASDEVLDKTFKIFSKGCSVINGKDKLSKEHLDYLRNRNLSDEDIISGGYFTLPKSNMLPYILKALKEEHGLDEKSLEYVPGFYRAKNGKLTFKYYDAIGIPIISAKGLYRGIQIRLNKEIVTISSKGKEKRLRYIWLSSEEKPEGCTCGASPGTPVDVTYPKTDKSTWSRNLFITEGKFKAQQLSKSTNAIVLSVQGVANWKDIPKEIKDIQSMYNNLISRIFVAYDADIAYKDQVNMHAKSMSNAMVKEFPNIPLLYCIWNPNHGKGMDDLIFNNKLSTVKTVKKKVYDALYNLIQKNLKEQKIDYATLPDEAKLKIFIECIYNRI